MKNLKNSKWFLFVLSGAVLYLFCTYFGVVAKAVSVLFGALSPLFLGAAIAYIINLPLKMYEKLFRVKGGKHFFIVRGMSILLSFLTVGALLFLVVSTIIPQLGECISLLVKKIPPFVNTTYLWAKETLNLSGDTASQIEGLLQSVNWENAVKEAVAVITSGMGTALSAVFSFLWSIVSVIFMLFVAVVFSVYLLFNKEKLAQQSCRIITAYSKEKFYRRFFKILTMLDESFSKFIVGQCLEAVILGSLVFVGMLVLRLPYYSMISVLIGFTALIPIAGAAIGTVIGGFMIFTDSPIKALIFVIFLLILQQIEGNVIYPRVVGKSIGLPGIWVLAAITVGGGVAGIVGMLVAVPIFCTIYALISENLKKREAKNMEQ